MKFSQYLTNCICCGSATSKAYARKNAGKCKACVTGQPKETFDAGDRTDRYHDYVASGAAAAGISFSDC